MLDVESQSPSPTADPGRHETAARLDVYISRECLNCAESVRLAEEVAARHPNIAVSVIDLDDGASPPPDAIVAVPTYLLNGQVISLGNPYAEELFARLREAVE